MRRPSLLCTLIIVLAVSKAIAQKTSTDYVNVQGLKLTLGMTQDTVFAGIAKQGLELKNLLPDRGNGRSSWLVTDPSLPPARSRTIADLRFVGNKLSGVYQDFGPSDTEAGVPFAQALWSVLRSFESEGKTSCTIQIGSRVDAGAKGSGASMEAWVSCGTKTIDISVVTGQTDEREMRMASLGVITGKYP